MDSLIPFLFSSEEKETARHGDTKKGEAELDYHFSFLFFTLHSTGVTIEPLLILDLSFGFVFTDGHERKK